MRQYSIDRVQLSWATLDLKEGIAQGTSIQEAKATQRWSMKPTGVGGIVRVYNPDRSGTVTATVDVESKLHQQLIDIIALDDVSRNQVFPMVMTDDSTGQVTTYVNAFLLDLPDDSKGTEAGTAAWMWGYERKITVSGSGTANLVGS